MMITDESDWSVMTLLLGSLSFFTLFLLTRWIPLKGTTFDYFFVVFSRVIINGRKWNRKPKHTEKSDWSYMSSMIQNVDSQLDFSVLFRLLKVMIFIFMNEKFPNSGTLLKHMTNNGTYAEWAQSRPHPHYDWCRNVLSEGKGTVLILHMHPNNVRFKITKGMFFIFIIISLGDIFIKVM